MSSFLSTLWGAQGIGEIRVMHSLGMQSHWRNLSDPGAADDLEIDFLGERDVFFGVLPRKRARGRAEDIDQDAVTVLWLDLDPKGGRTKSYLLGDLTKLSLPPHIVVDSGSGYHAYWLVMPCNWTNARHAMRGMAQVAGGDTVADPSRVMRLPGTINGKNGLTARVVRMDLIRDPYPIGAFAEYIDRSFDAETPLATFQSPRPRFPPPGIKEVPLWLVKKMDEDPGKGLRSEHVYHIVCSLMELGYSDEEIENLIADYEKGVGVKYHEQKNPSRWLSYSLRDAHRRGIGL